MGTDSGRAASRDAEHRGRHSQPRGWERGTIDKILDERRAGRNWGVKFEALKAVYFSPDF